MAIPAIKPIGDVKQLIDLSRFPPNLRKLGKHILKNGLNGTLKQTCEDLKLSYTGIATQIWREKKKGNDFNKFLNDIRYTVLDMAAMDVDTALIKGAVSGSNADRKLYYQLKGELSNDTNNVTVNVLSVSAPIATAPIDLTRDKGVIDLEPLMPDNDDEFT